MEYKKIVFFTLTFFSNCILGKEDHLREQVRRALTFKRPEQNIQKTILYTLNAFSHLAPDEKTFSYQYNRTTYYYTKTHDLSNPWIITLEN